MTLYSTEPFFCFRFVLVLRPNQESSGRVQDGGRENGATFEERLEKVFVKLSRSFREEYLKRCESLPEVFTKYS